MLPNDRPRTGTIPTSTADDQQADVGSGACGTVCAAPRRVDVEHHHDEQEQHHHGADVDQHQRDGEELAPAASTARRQKKNASTKNSAA